MCQHALKGMGAKGRFYLTQNLYACVCIVSICAISARSTMETVYAPNLTAFAALCTKITLQTAHTQRVKFIYHAICIIHMTTYTYTRKSMPDVKFVWTSGTSSVRVVDAATGADIDYVTDGTYSKGKGVISRLITGWVKSHT